jgi:hypothetical protein
MRVKESLLSPLYHTYILVIDKEDNKNTIYILQKETM